MIKPTLPEIGTKVTIFGVTGTVAYVEPMDDWYWSVEVEVPSIDGTVEAMRIVLPTDYHTVSGIYAY